MTTGVLPLVVFGALVVLTHATPTSAQTIYRCGADGSSYSHQPCAEGRAVEAGDARLDAERRDAESAVRRQARLAQGMERDRLEAPAPARPVRIDGRPVPEPEPAVPATASSKRNKPFKAVSKPTKKKHRVVKRDA